MIPLYSDAFPQSIGLYNSASSWTSTSVHPPLILSILPEQCQSGFLIILLCLCLVCSFPRFHVLTLLSCSLLLLPAPCPCHFCQISAWPSQNTPYKIAFPTCAPNLPYSTLFPHIICITTSYCIYLHVHLFTVCNLKVSSVRT